MLTEEQLDWLGEFAEYHVNDDYCSDRGYAESILTLLDAHWLHDGIYSDKLNAAIQEELENAYEYVSKRYVKTLREKTVLSPEWKYIGDYCYLSLLKNQPKLSNPNCTKCGFDLSKCSNYCCPHLDCPTGLGPTIC